MKRRWVPVVALDVVMVLGASMVLGACGPSNESAASARPTAVAAIFPLAATLRALVGPEFRVLDLTPPGVEPHDLELTTDQMDSILDAELVAAMGEGFQPALDTAAAAQGDRTVLVLAELRTGPDPHVWLDPVLMGRVADVLAAALVRVEPSRRPVINERLARVRDQLETLDARFRAGLARCERRTVVTAHDAFGRLARRYGLRPVAIAGIDPQQEPDPRRLADLADLVDRESLTTVFTERLVSRRVARTLATEAGVDTAVLDPIESPRGPASFAGYLATMKRNLGALRTALGCT